MRTPWRGGDDDGHSRNGSGPGHNNGVRPDGLETEASELDEFHAAPFDLAEVHADEELISALAAGRPKPAGYSGYVDDRLIGMLRQWRAEVEVGPAPPLVTVEQAVATIRKNRDAGRRRLLVPVAGAAAVLAVLLSGLVIGAHDARPGDPLWAMSKVLYQERAVSVEAAVQVETKLKKARSALSEGRTEDARKELAEVGPELAAVRSEEGKEVLASEAEFLAAKLATAAPGVPIDPIDASLEPSLSRSRPPLPSSAVPDPSSTVPVPPPTAPPQSSPGAGGPPAGPS